jgi:hypothetical protein
MTMPVSPLFQHEPVSPTPPAVYEPRFWRGRIWIKGGAFEGVGFVVRCPYGS